MKVRGDIEHVNLATGQRHVRISGDGESRLVPCDEHGVPTELEALVDNINPRARVPRGFGLWSAKMQLMWLRQNQGKKS